MTLASIIDHAIGTAFKAGLDTLDPNITLNHVYTLSGTYDPNTRTVVRPEVTVSVACVASTISAEDVNNGYAPDRAGRKFLIRRAALEMACRAANIQFFEPTIELTRAIHDGVNYTFSKVRRIPSGSLFIAYGRVT